MPAVVTSLGGNVPKHDGKRRFLFGYDIGISGGVTAMDDFLMEFFMTVYEKKMRAHEDNYCKYDEESLQLFTFSLYIAALVASFAASKACSKFGQRATMQVASFFFIVGIALQAGGINIAMLVFGRIILGCGVRFANQAVPLFLSELAPARIRGALNICFQLFITIGILVAGIINYFTSNIHPHGWRISLGLASVPPVVLLLGWLAICKTPTSLIERNQVDQGKATLRRIRGTDNIAAYFNLIVAASEAARPVKHPFSMLLQVFQQFTGINAIMFHAPVLFQTVGFGNNAALPSTEITGLAHVFSTLVSIYAVDRAGRRVLLLEACVQMFTTQTVIGLRSLLHQKPTGSLHPTKANSRGGAGVRVRDGIRMVMGSTQVADSNETVPFKTWMAAFACAVSSNMLLTFIIAQAFLSMICHLKAGIFFFFAAAWILIMGLFTLFLWPETKGVPMDLMDERVWKQHWFWKRYVINDDENADDNIIKE
ncbi:LOW QUALITY PROTEIN: hypothetical protein BT93_H2153 [Corymbia citriodora subsp. variegata]|nr:LOW QUALITY PROTEIN: hypothetical protein BT93_H2153 [Corymbia citriodora subsp. variegata]